MDVNNNNYIHTMVSVKNLKIDLYLNTKKISFVIQHIFWKINYKSNHTVWGQQEHTYMIIRAFVSVDMQRGLHKRVHGAIWQGVTWPTLRAILYLLYILQSDKS